MYYTQISGFVKFWKNSPRLPTPAKAGKMEEEKPLAGIKIRNIPKFVKKM